MLQTTIQVVNLIYFNTWDYTTQQNKINSNSYITNQGDMIELGLKVSHKYTTHSSCTRPKVYTKYRWFYENVIFPLTFPTIETIITKHIA